MRLPCCSPWSRPKTGGGSLSAASVHELISPTTRPGCCTVHHGKDGKGHLAPDGIVRKKRTVSTVRLAGPCRP